MTCDVLRGYQSYYPPNCIGNPPWGEGCEQCIKIINPILLYIILGLLVFIILFEIVILIKKIFKKVYKRKNVKRTIRK